MSDTIIQIYKNKSSAKPPAIHLPFGLQHHELTHPSLIQVATELFAANGVLTVHQLFSQAFIGQLYDAFVKRYHHYFGPQSHADALEVGDKRRMLTVEFQSPFNHPDLYGNPFLLSLMRSLLGDDVVLGSLGAVIALPGAEHQHIHRDHPPLFGDERFDLTLPSFAITLVVPLVDLTLDTGSTRVWKGSHRQSQAIETSMANSFVPLMPTGSCYLMDYQLLHGGTPNQSDSVRPILYIIYHRPWFQEAVNYDKQARLAIAPADYETIPEPYRVLFRQIRPAPLPQRTHPSFQSQQPLQPQVPLQPQDFAQPFAQPFARLSAEQQIERLAKVAKKALNQYGVVSTDIALLHHGENTTFSVKIADAIHPGRHHDGYDPHRLILRVSRSHYLSLDAIESELKWLHHLSQRVDFAVPLPIATMAGTFATWAIAPEVDEDAKGRVCALMQWVQGHPFDIDNPLDCDGMAKLEAAGRLLGQLHHYGTDDLISRAVTRPVWNWNGLFGQQAGYSDHGKKVWDMTPVAYRSVFEWISDQTKSVMSALGEDRSQFGLIHGDFWPGNLLWQDGTICPIDFADCGWGYWGYDIARFLSDFALSSAMTPHLKLLLNQVLKGYAKGRLDQGEGRSLPPEQLPHIPLFIAAQQATFGLWCVNRAQDHPGFRANLDHDLRWVTNNIDLVLNIPWP